MKIFKGRSKTAVTLIFFLSIFAITCLADENERSGGLFSEGSFLSDTISSATNKLNTVTSGREKIIDNDAKGLPQDVLEYDGDPLGRPLVKPSFRKNAKNLDRDI